MFFRLSVVHIQSTSLATSDIGKGLEAGTAGLAACIGKLGKAITSLLGGLAHLLGKTVKGVGQTLTILPDAVGTTVKHVARGGFVGKLIHHV